MSRTDPAEIGLRLAAGEVAVLPTETVYGLGIVPGQVKPLTRVFELKGRPPDLNLPVLISGLSQLEELGVDFNSTARQLAQRFWPGPLTIVMGFTESKRRPDWLKDRIEVAIRFPAFEFLVRIANTTGPLLLTSANAHGEGAKDTVHDALHSLLGEPDFAVDAGTLARIPSTIINTRRAPAVLERTGAITATDLDSFIRAKTLTVESWNN